MSWGFEATNTRGQVLISSETRNLHFVGKAALVRIIRQTDGYGGLRHYAYQIECNVTPVPFFSMPTQDFYGVVAVRQVSGRTWEIEVIRSGYGSQSPEVYVFCDPRGITAGPQTNYGMQVFRDDGTLSFDSRYRPLVVSDGLSVVPPANPITVTPPGLSAKYCESMAGAASGMAPNNQNTYITVDTSQKPIYFYPSIAQAQREFEYYQYEEKCRGFSYGICIGYEKSTDWFSNYWVFCRGGIKRSGAYMFAGWVSVEFGCNWRSFTDRDLFGFIDIGGGQATGGRWPYSNETLNLSPTAVIVADGLKYD